MTERRCANPACRKQLVRRINERAPDFADRQTCGRDCAGAVISAKNMGRTHCQAGEISHWTRELRPWPADVWFGDDDVRTDD